MEKTYLNALARRFLGLKASRRQQDDYWLRLRIEKMKILSPPCPGSRTELAFVGPFRSVLDLRPESAIMIEQMFLKV